MRDPLVDGWDREIKSLRVSVTDKCNFRCKYCMPAEGLAWLPREEILTFEEMARILRVMADMGVEQIRPHRRRAARPARPAELVEWWRTSRRRDLS